jgi:CRP/FNR family transcriptional regulator
VLVSLDGTTNPAGAAGAAHRRLVLRGVPLLGSTSPGIVDFLTETHRHRLARHATVEVFRRRDIVFREGEAADAIYIVSDGVVKAFRHLPSGKRRIVAFLFAGDVGGLPESGRYINSVQAITPVTVCRLDVGVLTEMCDNTPGLEHAFLCKIVHELRESQRHAVILGRRDAAGRLAMLLRLLEGHACAGDGIPIPMTRSDIASYLGLSLEGVVRSMGRLKRDGIIDFHGRHEARVLDRERFDALVSAL